MRLFLWKNQIIIFFFSVVYLFLCIQYDVLNAVPDKMEAHWNNNQSHFAIINSLQYYQDHREQCYYGPLRYVWSIDKAYYSQVGLMRIIYSIATCGFDVPIEKASKIFRIIASATTAIVLGAFCLYVYIEYSVLVYIILILFISFSQWILLSGSHIAWGTMFLFLPFVVTMIAYPRMEGRNSKRYLLFTIIGILVAIKSLAGYEFITNIILGPSCAVLYHELRIEYRIRRKLLKRVFIITSCGVLGFLTAIMIHLAQIQIVSGGEGFEKFFSKVRSRTIAANSDRSRATAWDYYTYDENGNRVENKKYILKKYKQYLRHYFVRIPQIRYDHKRDTWTLKGRQRGVRMWVMILFTGVLGVFYILIKRKRHLAMTVMVSFLAAISWNIMAIGHAINHAHINALTFYLPYLLFAFLLVGDSIDMVKVKIFRLMLRK